MVGLASIHGNWTPRLIRSKGQNKRDRVKRGPLYLKLCSSYQMCMLKSLVDIHLDFLNGNTWNPIRKHMGVTRDTPLSNRRKLLRCNFRFLRKFPHRKFSFEFEFRRFCMTLNIVTTGSSFHRRSRKREFLRLQSRKFRVFEGIRT